jgi:hypothetical protein
MYASRPWAFELIVMAVPLEQQKLVEEAARQFEELLWKLHVRPARWPYQGTTDAVGDMAEMTPTVAARQRSEPTSRS